MIDSLKSGWFGAWPKVAQFENDFKLYKCVDHAVVVNSCTAALHLSMIAAGLKPEDEVITFCSTVNSIIHAGAMLVLVDVNPMTMNINPDQIKEKVTKNTKAILSVHFAGHSCDMNAKMNIAKCNTLKENFMNLEI